MLLSLKGYHHEQTSIFTIGVDSSHNFDISCVVIFMNNDNVIQTFNYEKKVMSEEVLHKNPGAKILPTQPVPYDLPTCDHMIEILHKICGEVAFYYTHVPQKLEMMTATRARTLSGGTIEPGAPMICGSCKCGVEPSELQVSKSDYEAAHGKS